VVTKQVADHALQMLDVDGMGFDVMDRKLLLTVLREVRRRPGRV
jgi:Holliday junction DNA helicase RuvB